ncbi:helix-turn-helix domain-containing protein [Variovorax guangxiensis]|uniref:Helix-turn-helix domain-containing protein n=1 Tax=Variovorax guangxiensis TaxID=1775474 RepID=A0A3S0XDP8_9BURK|nr:helix-turn-helix transcriptional regulator [Variovorax guangxiensis]RUR70986.1 helix-turn-helix domain-containing protein [Variovorax guangxiensis]
MARIPPPLEERHPALTAFGEAVRRQRKALGYSQEAFADACEIDRSYMGGVERGERNLAMINIMRIIETLGMRPADFFQGMDYPKKKRTKTTQ